MEQREDYAVTVVDRAPQGVALRPVMDIAAMLDTRTQVLKLLRQVMTNEVDFGQIPGTPRPTLYKPGAEKLARFFGLRTIPTLEEAKEVWSDIDQEGFFYYRYRVSVYFGDTVIAEYDAICHSHEEKYRWRWVPESEVPPYLDKTQLMTRGGSITELKFAVEKAETSGKFGKPPEYWAMFKDAIAARKAKIVHKTLKSGKVSDAYEIEGTLYRVPNPAVDDLAHTISAIAQKRALVGAVRIATNATDIFSVSDYVGEEEDETSGEFGTDTYSRQSSNSAEQDQADVAGEQSLTSKQAVNLIRQAVGKQPEASKEVPPLEGELGAMVGRLNKLLGSDEARHQWLKAVFGKESSKALNEAQVKAVLSASDATIKAVIGSGEMIGK